MAGTENGSRALRATYRLQLHGEFNFQAASAIVPYLKQLGISHIYSSPYLQSAKGSKHGYDVVDPLRLNEELGGEPEHRRFCQAITEEGLGQIVDFVPNHMCVTECGNSWWRDVLEHGPCGQYACYFDIDWESADDFNRNRVLLPVLADRYSKTIESGAIKLEVASDGFQVRYGNDSFPVAPKTWDQLLSYAATLCSSDELAFLADCFKALAHTVECCEGSGQRQSRKVSVLKRHLFRLMDDDQDVESAIASSVAKFSSDAELLDNLLSRQHYRLAHWRTASDEIDYRRFFDVTSLASLRVEEEQVFNDVHSLLIEWIRSGTVDGVRIDHVDGLRDPYGYLVRLRERAPKAWIGVEKILAINEALPGVWPIQGDTGYEFMNLVLRMFIVPQSEKEFTALYHETTGDSRDWRSLWLHSKRRALQELFAAELTRLTDMLLTLCRGSRRLRDFTRREVAKVIVEFVAALEVYRTYVRAEDRQVSEEDEGRIERTTNQARRNCNEYEADLIDFLQDVLLCKQGGAEAADFVMRLQQLSGPVMAKGVEDTAFYVYNRFVALNEVGGAPGMFGQTVEDFHTHCRHIHSRFPQTLSATSTHDTKRSEDVRARLAVLSEMPHEWTQFVCEAMSRCAVHRVDNMPDSGTIYLLLQTVVGAWPIDVQRLQRYMRKAAREAKVMTSWTAPNEKFEHELNTFVERLLCDDEFMSLAKCMIEKVAGPGQVNSLTQTLLKCTAPGVPDIYQGQEVWDYSLVDPDNRRPVDYSVRIKLLAELPSLSVSQVLSRWNEGVPKLWVTYHALRLRRVKAEAFDAESDYTPLYASGSCSQHFLGMVRGGKVVAAAPRWTTLLQGGWQDTTVTLPEGEWTNVLTGAPCSGPIPINQLFAEFPVALLAVN